MKAVTVLVAITVSVICLTVTCTIRAAPVQIRTNSDLAALLKAQLLKSIVGQAFIQQEESLSSEDKERAVTYCKLIVHQHRCIHHLLIENHPGMVPV